MAAADAAPAQALNLRGARPKGEITKVKGYCPFCQVRCTYTALVRNGRIESLVGEPDNPWTHGTMCPKGLSLVELVRSPSRITEPLLKQPDGTWKPIAYTDALDLIVQRVEACQREHGETAGDRIALTGPLWDCRESELAAEMTLSFMGSRNLMPAGEVCISSASNMLGLMTGVNTSTTTVNEICNCETLVLWGANIAELYPPYSNWLDKARNAGVNIVYLDPRRTRTSLCCSSQLSPRPGTDGAMAMGAIRHILATGSYDADRAGQLISDLDMLREDVEPYTLEKVAGITGVPKELVEEFADTLGRSRRTIIWLGGSLSRYTNGIQSLRAVMLLQGLRDNLIGSGKGLLTMEGGKPAGEDEFIDHICGPNDKPRMNFRRLFRAMSKGQLDILFLNSSYRRYPDSKNVRAAIQKVPFVVHRGFFLTEEAEVANLFMPATFSPESQGSHYGAEKQVVWREKVVDAPGSCVPDWQFYRDIGRRIAGDRYPRFERPEDLYRLFVSLVPSWRGLTLERLRKAQGGMVWPRYHENDPERLGTSFTQGKLLTPDGRMPVDDSVFGRINWSYPRGNPQGRDNDPKYPLVLLQGKVLTQWQQTLTNYSEALSRFSHGRFVNIHPDTAAEMGVKDGDMVALETATGSLEARVELCAEIVPGIVFTPSHFNRTAPFAQNRSDHINLIVPNYWDRISSQVNGVGCTIRKLQGA
ncbi:molybdopterin-containing oxidoreductase family protein [Pseudodesulfovibrio mercurii]|uniref:molybdopterin-containing oxidoreductase family protein n=1 Tax=Pseudodesulfovibrio mercurii TaxID=641491 RepID=UPI0002D43140|nr:molybdopterin-dependent oxidoreductase [Pseudodesulfovibrio mercurii]